jgi:hypothetical protein
VHTANVQVSFDNVTSAFAAIRHVVSLRLSICLRPRHSSGTAAWTPWVSTPNRMRRHLSVPSLRSSLAERPGRINPQESAPVQFRGRGGRSAARRTASGVGNAAGRDIQSGFLRCSEKLAAAPSYLNLTDTHRVSCAESQLRRLIKTCTSRPPRP